MALNWIKKWIYMILWVMAGVIYLSVVDDWQVYAKPLEQVRSWYEEVKQDFRRAASVQAGGGPVRAAVSGAEGITVSGPEGTAVPEAEEAALPEAEGTDAPGTEETAVSGIVPADDGQPPLEAESVGEPAGTGLLETPEVSGGTVFSTVEDDYFTDAVFIGDSRTVGMCEYGGLEGMADFYASTGLTIYKLFDSEIVAVEGQKKKISVEQALTENSYAKIYLMIGINEMGTGTVESFAAAYKEAADHLLELQPDAILYIQGIIKVTTERSEQGDYINNEGIEERNEALAQLADNERIFYLDVNPEICDDTGGMIASYTFDGVHLKAQYIDIWKTYLKEHAVVRRD